MSEVRLSVAKAFLSDLDPADFPDPYREMLPDESPVTFTHADLNPVSIMVSKESSCHVIAIIDWEKCGWYPPTGNSGRPSSVQSSIQIGKLSIGNGSG